MSSALVNALIAGLHIDYIGFFETRCIFLQGGTFAGSIALTWPCSAFIDGIKVDVCLISEMYQRKNFCYIAGIDLYRLMQEKNG